MAPKVDRPLDLAGLVDHMFDQVLGADERAELLIWIEAWEEANPGVDAAHRVTGWIDVAYAFQSRSLARQEVRNPVRSAPDSVPARGSSPTFA